ncbi:uncharacterized protein [Henckelia pumila]|uniref:uncharacterized protein n=1 Tax=Henckelia pumila TaxID=405737 RepID=UPI003C6DC57B
MLVDSYEDATKFGRIETDRAHVEAEKSRAAAELIKKLEQDLMMAQQSHDQVASSLRSALEAAEQGLHSAQLDRARSEADLGQARDALATTTDELRAAENRAAEAQAEAASARDKAEKAVSALKTRLKSEEELKENFLSSAEFQEAVVDRSYTFFQVGFYKCRDQFEEAGLWSSDKRDFPDLDKAIDSLPATQGAENAKAAPSQTTADAGPSNNPAL